MSTSARKSSAFVDLQFIGGKMVLKFADGRELRVPLSKFPRLAHASEAQLNNWELIGSGIGIHWPELDEDLSIVKLLDPNMSLEPERSEKSMYSCFHAPRRGAVA